MWKGERFLQTNFSLSLVPLVNVPYLFSGASIHIVLALIGSIFIGIMEELIFRSFYATLLSKYQTKIRRSSFPAYCLFGCLHLMNIRNYPLVFILLQVTYAFAIGIAFSVVFYESKSVLPCILVHIAVDFTGSFEIESILLAKIIGTIVCCICAIYFFTL